MKKIKYFDYYKIANEKGISLSTIRNIEKEVKKEFPDDPLLYELHILRAIKNCPAEIKFKRAS